MLKRKAFAELKRWKDEKDSQGLLVTGARQVGKTWLIRAFAKENYAHFAEINLIENRRAAKTLSEAENADDLILRLSILANTKFTPGKTLIFIDEVQECKEIVTAIKFLAERNLYDFILSGSLLGVELKDIHSAPVGYLDTVQMFPLDFEEFCTANGVPDESLFIAKDCFINRGEVPDYIHERLLRLFHEYLIVGGMPAAVASFVENRNLLTVRRIQQNLILQNKHDVAKYNERDALIIKEIYDLIPAELNNQNKRFILKDMNQFARFGRYQECFVWLADAGVALPTFNVDKPIYPLMLSKASNLFKLFMADVGLLTSAFFKSTTLDILDRNPNVNYGSIYENAIAQELTAQGFAAYYYKSKKLGEVDFVIETLDGKVTPVEVKSGKDYKRHNALGNILEHPEYRIEEGFVLCDANISRREKVTYLPVYMSAFFSFL